MTRSQSAVPSWITKVIVTAIIGALCTGFAAWGRTLSTKANTHETRITVIEEHQKGLDKSLDKIEASQQRMEDKLDRALRRR